MTDPGTDLDDADDSFVPCFVLQRTMYDFEVTVDM